MRLWQRFSTLLLAVGLLTQFAGLGIEDPTLAKESENILTEARTAGVITECLLTEAPLANQISKAGAVLASSRLAHRHIPLCLADVQLIRYDQQRNETLSLHCYRSVDNRGPPLC